MRNYLMPNSYLRVIRLLAAGFFTAGFLLLSPSSGYARSAVENLAAEIRMSSGAVGQVLMEAMQAKFGEIDKWRALDEKMSELGQTIDRNLPAIGEQIAVIFEQNPGAYTPSVEIGQTFDGNLNMVRGKKKELSGLANAERQKLQKVNDMIARVDKDLLNAARGLIGATIEGFLPGEVALAGEAGVVVLGAYFGPPGIVAASIAWAGAATFNALINTYYNTKAAADQARVLGEMKQGLAERRRQIEEGLKNLTDGVREMDQIEQILERHSKTLDSYIDRINQAREQWNGKSQNAFESQKRKLEEEIRKIEAQPKQPVRLGSGYHGMDPIPPIEPGEYMGEVSSILGQLSSYAQAVEDGGDPDIFLILAQDWFKRTKETLQKRTEDYEQPMGRYREASWKTHEIITKAGQPYYKASEAFWAAIRERRYGDWNLSNEAGTARLRMLDQFRAVQSAAYAALEPFGQALINPYREMVKASLIIDNVNRLYYRLEQRVETSVVRRTTEFWQTYDLWRNKFEQATTKAYQTVSDVPSYLASWEKRAQRIDEEVADALRWGGNIAAIRSGLLTTAEYLHALDRTVKEAIKNYQPANNARTLLANQAQADLNSLLARYGRQINYGTYFNLDYWRPRSAQQAETIKSLASQVKSSFTVTEPWNLAEARKVNLPAIAKLYENKAQELSFYTDWIDTYLHRLTGAAARLDRISREQTGAGFYAEREGSPQDTLAKELMQPPFGAISREVETLVTAGELEKLPWVRFQPWAGMTPGQKLNTAQQAILQKMQTEIAYYVQARKSGWFQPVAEDIIKPLEARWQKLSALCKLYDSAVAPLRDGVRSALEDISKDAALVGETWSRMPAQSRNVVSDRHSRFSAKLQWLSGYLSLKSNALQYNFDPAKNTALAELEMLIAGYRPALEKYRRDQEEALRRQEEALRRYEEEQRRLADEQRKQAEEELKRQEELRKRAEVELNHVKNLYAAFKSAYESRNDSQVMSLIGDSWESGDGTTLADLQSNLRRSFRTFDEIRYNIQNLRITPSGAGRFNASYDVTITSRIFRRNLRHEEKSSVNEEVAVDAAGRARILRTLTGRFWAAQ